MSYFEGAQNGDRSRHTTNHGPVSHIDDYSQHSTTYKTYVNRGQHAESRGTINNYGLQTTANHGYFANNDWFRMPPGLPDDRYGPTTGTRPSNPNPDPPHRQSDPPQDPPMDTDPTYGGVGGEEFNGYEAEDLSRRSPSPMVQEPTASSHYAQRSPRDDPLNEQFEKLSPGMQRYVQSLIQQRNTSHTPNLHEYMARGDAEPSSRPSNAPRSPPPPSSSSGSYLEDDRRRTVITNIDSGNLNSTTVVDSHNDNSTRTEISRAR